MKKRQVKKQDKGPARPGPSASQNWRLYQLDYQRFITIEDVLATQPAVDQLRALANTPLLDKHVTRVLKKKLSYSTLCHEILIAHCGCTDPIDIEARLVYHACRMKHKQKVETFRALLHGLSYDSRNMPDWLICHAPIRGILSPEETRELYSALIADPPRMRPRGTDFMSFIMDAARVALNASYDFNDTMTVLLSFLRAASERGMGLMLTDA